MLAAIEKSGEAFLSNALVGGKFLLRACIVNFNTTLGDVEALIPLISRLASGRRCAQAGCGSVALH